MGEVQEFDRITGLPFFDDFIRTCRVELMNPIPGRQYFFISTDVNNFKYINRIYGFERANDMLFDGVDLLFSQQNHIISSCRTHSDHIISLAYYFDSREDAQARVEEFSMAFVRKNAGRYRSVSLHLNNGIYFMDDPNEDIMFAMDKANVARRIAKGNYCVGSVVFCPEMLERKSEDAKILAMFEDSLKSDRVRVYYQPKIDVETKEICGAEALSRIFDKEDRLIYPDTYIPILENSGKVVELDCYVMRTVFEHLQTWLKEGRKVVPVSINLSRMHFYEKNVSRRLFEEFERYHIPIHLVEFELTESLFFADANLIIEEIRKLREYGFKVSMDDFGVGYSTLNALGSLPVDIIKFDKGFVHSSMESNAGYQILHSLIEVMRKIDYQVVCEGIETKAEEEQIRNCGCEVIQGYLYDRPIPTEEFCKKYLPIMK